MPKSNIQRELDNCSVSMAMQHDPLYHMRYVGPVSLPLPDDVANDLFWRMNQRFELWTGKTLREWINDQRK